MLLLLQSTKFPQILYSFIKRVIEPCIFFFKLRRKAVLLLNSVLVAKSCLTFVIPPMDYGPPGSSLHGILQARILEWVAIPFSRESS